MKYKDLLEELQKLTPEQLNQNVSVARNSHAYNEWAEDSVSNMKITSDTSAFISGKYNSLLYLKEGTPVLVVYD
jgi:hypothetical protein